MHDLGEYDKKLGVCSTTRYDQVVKILSTMDIYIEEDGFVYYNDMLYAVLKRKHAKRKNIKKVTG